jgi:ketosteroid isomerase-like protein
MDSGATALNPPSAHPAEVPADAANPTAEAAHLLVATYRRMIAAFNANDLGTVREILADDVAYTMPGRSELAGTTRGVAAHLAMLRRARELSAGTLSLEPEALAVDGQLLFVWGTIRATRGARRLEAKHCVVFRFSQGKIVEGHTVPTDLYAFDDFWSSL